MNDTDTGANSSQQTANENPLDIRYELLHSKYGLSVDPFKQDGIEGVAVDILRSPSINPVLEKFQATLKANKIDFDVAERKEEVSGRLEKQTRAIFGIFADKNYHLDQLVTATVNFFFDTLERSKTQATLTTSTPLPTPEAVAPEPETQSEHISSWLQPDEPVKAKAAQVSTEELSPAQKKYQERLNAPKEAAKAVDTSPTKEVSSPPPPSEEACAIASEATPKQPETPKEDISSWLQPAATEPQPPKAEELSDAQRKHLEKTQGVAIPKADISSWLQPEAAEAAPTAPAVQKIATAQSSDTELSPMQKKYQERLAAERGDDTPSAER